MPHNPDIWFLLYEQTPPMLRWLFGILTAGLYFLARYIWRQHQERIAVLEALVNSAATTDDITRLEQSFGDGLKTFHSRMDELMIAIIKE